MKTGRRLLGRFASGKGAAAVELALVIPLFMLMTFGLLEFGHAWYIQHGLTNASREGARHGIVYYADKDGRLSPSKFTSIGVKSITEVVDNYLKKYFQKPGQPEPEVFWEVKISGENLNTAGSDLTVTVKADKEWFVLGALVPGLGSNITLTAATTMKLE